MDVRMPDGTVVSNVPDNITQSDLMQRYAASTQKTAAVDTAKSDTGMENFNAAVGGALYAPWLGVKAITGNASPEDVQQWKDSMAGLWTTKMGKLGTLGGGVAAAAPGMMLAGSSVPAAGVIGATQGLVQPESDWLTRGRNMLLGAAGGAGGQAVGNAVATKVADAAATKAAADQMAQSQNAVRDQTIKDVTGAGYKLPPNLVDQPSMLQSLGGKIKTEQAMSRANSDVTNNLVRQEFGLAPDTALSSKVLDQIRTDAGQAYNPVRALGVVNSDPAFQAAAQGIENSYNAVSQSFKSLRNPEIETLIGDLKSPQFDANGIVEAVKRFRADGFANMASQDPGKKALGRIQLQAQDQLEGLLDRTLATNNMPDAMQALQQARRTIAKTYSVQKALEDSTGNVVASDLGRQFSNGKPLSGNLETIGKMAEAFPKAVQNVPAPPPFSPLDAFAALGHGAAAAATFGARPLARAVVQSGPYQRAFIQPSYGPGLMGDMADLLGNPGVQTLGRSLALSGLLGTPK